MKKFFLCFWIMVSGCTTTSHQSAKTWILPTVETHPEEQYVADKAPVIPVEIENILPVK
tara:strand:- start:476 stop:652 length:177 start_codon:yes stop_codon:yes gene_type:complete